MLRPERLVDPEAFSTIFVYLNAMRTPTSPYLPSTWALDGVMGMLRENSIEAALNLTLSWSGALTIFFFQAIISDGIYFRGLSKAQSGRERLFKGKNRLQNRVRGFSGPVPAIVVKEVKTFLRDQTQWSQIFLIGALVVIYIYNFKVLPLEKSPIQTVYLQNLLSFLNMGLVSFVLIAVAARFAYPAVGMEKEAFWLIRSTPVCLKSFLRIKFVIYLIPLLVLSEILVVATNTLLHVTPFIMWLSVATVFLMVPGIVSMGIGIGAIYPDFKSENPSQSVTSWGGLIFMMTAAAFVAAVIILEAGPVYRLFMADLKGHRMEFIDWLWAVGSFSGVVFLSVFAAILPMRLGEKQLESSE
jgi:ABC-2 type transport system permease protein